MSSIRFLPQPEGGTHGLGLMYTCEHTGAVTQEGAGFPPPGKPSCATSAVATRGLNREGCCGSDSRAVGTGSFPTVRGSTNAKGQGHQVEQEGRSRGGTWRPGWVQPVSQSEKQKQLQRLSRCWREGERSEHKTMKWGAGERAPGKSQGLASSGLCAPRARRLPFLSHWLPP